MSTSRTRSERERDALARIIARAVAGGHDLAAFKGLVADFVEHDETLGDAYRDTTEDLADADLALHNTTPKGQP